MARLPQPGGDKGTWGSLLNDFLSVDHNPDGTLKSSGTLAGKANVADLAPVATSGSYTDLTDTPTIVTSVATKTGDVTLTKTDVGLSNVDNTSDVDKPVSTATQTAITNATSNTAIANLISISGATQSAVDARVTAGYVSPIFSRPSTTNLTTTFASKTVTIAAPHNFNTGMYVRLSSENDVSVFMEGTVTAVTSTTVTFFASIVNDPFMNGSDNLWTLSLAGPRGETGATGTSSVIAERLDFAFNGTLTAQTGALPLLIPNTACHITEIIVVAGTQPTGQNIIVDVKNNGSTIFASQSNRPFIAPGSPYAYANGTGLNIAVQARARITVDVIQVGSGTAGANMTVSIWYTRG